MKQRHATATASALFALLPLSLLLFRLLVLLVRLRLAAFRDAALSLHFLARLRIRPVHLRLPGTDATTVRVWCPAAPSAKPPLLLLHGFGGDSKWTWARNLPALSRHFHVYAPDLLFFGAHSRSASPLRTVAFQARCAAEAMRLLGVDRYDVVGISYGGFVAYRLAAVEGRDRVPRVVVMTSGVAATPGEMREMAAREERAVEESLLPETADGLRRLVRRSMHRPPPWMPDFVLDDFIKNPLSFFLTKNMYIDRFLSNLAGRARVKYRSAIQYSYTCSAGGEWHGHVKCNLYLMCVVQRKERAELLHELLKNGAGIDPLPVLTQKTLILWGDKDQVFPLDLGHRLQRHLGDVSRLEIIKDAGHALQLEGADQVNRFIKSFLLDS
uniref:AB hydrolase-1 domain-containing protein n=1 Tax=Oryza sativa subsp. japonica TaxID=39947 RepID=Q8H024_ORYSJ|nr:Hypothetical protein [Oryza sativa Japonica Group]